MLEYTLIAGILFGLFFSFMALGLNLIFGVLEIVNLAHGDFVMLGAFGAYLGYHALGINPLLVMVAELVLFLLVGIALYYGIVPSLLKSEDPEMLSLIMFFGISQVVEALAVFAFGNNPRTVNPGLFGLPPVHIMGQSFQFAWVASAGASVVGLLAVYWYLYHTRWGIATRAIMGNREEAASSGINVDRISAVAFGLGLGLAAAAGALSPLLIGGITPSMGINLTTTAFAIIVIGSLGNPLGTILGGLVYGLSSMLMQSYLSSWSDLAPFVLLLAILLLKPGGLFGQAERYA